MEVLVTPYEYDRYGRMKYHPDIHFNQGNKWDKEEVEYLKEWYPIVGPEEISYALGRTIMTVQAKAGKLGIKAKNSRPRINGRMK